MGTLLKSAAAQSLSSGDVCPHLVQSFAPNGRALVRIILALLPANLQPKSLLRRLCMHPGMRTRACQHG